MKGLKVMRIVLEIDGMRDTVISAPHAPGPDAVAPAEDAASDAGAGPGGGASGVEAADATVVTDSDPPPSWLLEAVAAAEAAGRNTGPADAAYAGDELGDAGAGPGA
jgi:hypothetical protein